MTKRYRYPGVRPFEAADRAVFFGRDRDRDDLLGLIELEKLVVLFGKSGNGKSSLLNVAIIPALQDRKFITLKIRLGSLTSDPTITPVSLITRFFEMEASQIPPLNPDMDFLDDVCLEKSLWYEFKRRQLSRDVDRSMTWVLLFDQFEEYFQQVLAFRRGFEEHLAEVLYTDIPQPVLDRSLDCTDEQIRLLTRPLNVRVVFSIRSDRLGELDDMKSRLPAILHNRFELKGMSRTQATSAIVRPAELIDPDFAAPPFLYSTDAIDGILDQLASGSKGSFEDRIETSLLQILCQHIENHVIATGNVHIEKADVPDATRLFENFYRFAIAQLPENWRDAARHLVEDELIFENEQTGESRRLSLDEDMLAQICRTYGASKVLLQQLESNRILRRNVNPYGGFNHEISHDTLLKPILKLKRERRQVEREASVERERAEALAQARHETARRRRANVLTAVASLLFLIAAGLGFWAMQQQEKARKAQTVAEQERDNARVALEKFKRAEAGKVLLEVNDILTRAERLRADYPDNYRSMIAESRKILEQYPENSILQDKLKTLPQ